MSMIQKALFEGYSTSILDITTMFMCVIFTALIALYICVVYRMVNKNSFFSRSFHMSLFALAVITSAIILTIQSNVVVSLGMVGALSIVRFRTAIKDPMDLVFLFWSISVGIICGAGFAMISIIASVMVTMGIVVFHVMPAEKESLILVINAVDEVEDELLQHLDELCKEWKIRARNVSKAHVNYAIEIRTEQPHELIRMVKNIGDVTSVSLVEHDGEVTA